MKAPHPPSAIPHRGYSAPGREKAFTKEELSSNSEIVADAKGKIMDFQETFEVGDESNREMYNIWLPESVMPGFRDFVTKMFWRLHETSNAVLEALMMSLSLTNDERNTIGALHTGYSDQLRLAHYPPVSTAELSREDLGRLPAHTDWRYAAHQHDRLS